MIRMEDDLHVIGNLVGGSWENQEQCVQSLMLSESETSRDSEDNHKTFLNCLVLWSFMHIEAFGLLSFIPAGVSSNI